MPGELLPNLIVFARGLRQAGLPANPEIVIDFTNALEWISLERRADVYHAARCFFVHRREDLERFDQAFDAFWRARPGRPIRDLRVHPDQGRVWPSTIGGQAEASSDRRSSLPGSAGPSSDPAGLGVSLLGYTAAETLRNKDFARLNEAERAEVRRLIRRLARPRWTRRSHRLAPGRGPNLDLRQALRRSFRHGGEWLEWPELRRTDKSRRVVFLADVSGSMTAYSRLLLEFGYAVARGHAAPVEVFAFGTRLTRLTRPMRTLSVDEALARVARLAEDWSGGTRIGEALRRFNRTWARRSLSSGAIAIVASDGWDRGDPELLAAEMARLRRRAHRVIWVSPLLGIPGYQPETRGLVVALPYVDAFLPANNLASLESLAELLEEASPSGLPRAIHPRGRTETEGIGVHARSH
jgi:uncharacterized protein with von Willebrand factor type A (vWA) domain